MKTRILTAVLCTLIACSSDDAKNDAPAAAPTDPGATTESTGFKFSTGKFTIEPGDNFECFYTDSITQTQLNVQSAKGHQGPGGHHLIVYYTDQKVDPGHHKCLDQEMIALHQIAGTGDSKEGIVGLPDGYAIKVPAGKQLVVQAHYIRTEATPLEVEDFVELETVEEKDVKAFANAFVVFDGSFNLQPHSRTKSTVDCVLARDFDVLLLLGHMHEWGAHYRFERVDEHGKPLETIYETDWDPLYTSHPPVHSYDPAKPLHLAKGTRVRQTCEWQNTEDHEMAYPREMCVMFSYYIPDDGFIMCDTEKAVTE